MSESERIKLKGSRSRKSTNHSVSSRITRETEVSTTSHCAKRKSSDYANSNKRLCRSPTVTVTKSQNTTNLAKKRLSTLRQKLADDIQDSRHSLQRNLKNSTNTTKSINSNYDRNKKSRTSLNNRLKKAKSDSVLKKTFAIECSTQNVYGSSKSIVITRDVKENDNSTISKNENLESGEISTTSVCPINHSENKSEDLNKFSTSNWVEAHHQSENRHSDICNNDSMIVNVNESVTNKCNVSYDLCNDDAMEWDTTITESVFSEHVKKENGICIVIDTNVFMHYLYKVKDIVNFQVSGSQNLKIFVPWMVITELDFIKDNSKDRVKSSALNAAKFINANLEAKNSKIIGQSVEEAIKQKDIGSGPDDKILASCLQVGEKYETVILLSNDVNLRNKALMNDLEACSPHDIMQKLLFKLKKNIKSSKILHKMSKLCSQIITDCCKEAYGDVWNRMDMLHDPPWSFLDCIKRISRYWRSVFREKILKQCYSTLTYLQEVLERSRGHICDDSDTFNDFMKKVFELLIFLKDVPGHKQQVNVCIDEIIQIAK